jgi:hypothetical protein
MMNVFAGNKSGMQSMFESILPPDVLEAIKIAKEQLPQVIALVQASVARIEGKLDMVNDKTTLLLRKVESIRLEADTNAVPDVLPSQEIELLNAASLNALNGENHG